MDVMRPHGTMTMAKNTDSEDECGVFAIQNSGAGNEVYLHIDGPGLRRLQTAISQLADAAEAGRCDHDHLMGPAWGGWELTDNPPQPEKKRNGNRRPHQNPCLAGRIRI